MGLVEGSRVLLSEVRSPLNKGFNLTLLLTLLSTHEAASKVEHAGTIYQLVALYGESKSTKAISWITPVGALCSKNVKTFTLSFTELQRFPTHWAAASVSHHDVRNKAGS